MNSDIPFEQVYTPPKTARQNFAGRMGDDLKSPWMTQNPLLYLTYYDVSKVLLPRIIDRLSLLESRIKRA